MAHRTPHRAVLALALLLSGCPGSGDPVGPSGDACTGRTVAIKGRVVDFETCLTQAGCQGLAGVTVSLLHNSAVASRKTAADGTFSIDAAPDGVRMFLYVSDAGGTHAPCLQATPIDTRGQDVFGVELFALRQDGGLLPAITGAAKVSLTSDVLYLGQVFRVQNASMKALPDVTVTASPAAKLRFVRCPPSFSQCKGEPTLWNAKRTTTGIFGQFLVVGSAPGDHTVLASAKQFSFPAVTAPLARGYLTIGVHQGTARPGAADAGR